MIVVDGSVWIAQLRGLRTSAVVRIERIVDDGDILVGDIVLMEILQGAGDEIHASRLARQMRRFPIVTTTSETLVVEAARNHRILRDRGVTVPKMIDMIIGAFCIAHEYALLHDDRDFDPMQRHLELRVA